MFSKVIESNKTTTSTYIILNIRTRGTNIMDKMCESRRSTHQQKRAYFLSFRWNPTEGGPAELVNVSWAIRETSQKTPFFYILRSFPLILFPLAFDSPLHRQKRLSSHGECGNFQPTLVIIFILSSAFNAPAIDNVH